MNLFSFLSRLRHRLLSHRHPVPRIPVGLSMLRLEERRLLDATFAFNGIAGLQLGDFDLTGSTSELSIGQSGNELTFELDGGSWSAGGGHVADAGIQIDSGNSRLLRVDRSVFEDGGDQFSLDITDNLTIGLDVQFGSDMTLPASPTAGSLSISANSITVGSQISADVHSLNFAGSGIQFQGDVITSGDGTFDAGTGQLTDTDGVTLQVGGRLTAAGATVVLGDESGNVLHAGQLQFQSTGAVSIAEDSATTLTGPNTAATLNLTSNGSLTSAAASSLTVSGQASLSADSIDLNDTGGQTLNLGSLQFAATGDVHIEETDGLHLAANSQTSGDLTLSAGGNLTADAGVTLSGDDVSLTAAESGTEAGQIGAVSDAFSVDATSLTTSSAGDQFLSTNGTINVLHLDSNDASTAFDVADGAGSIHLQDGHFLLDAVDASDGHLIVNSPASINGTGQIDGLQLTSGAELQVDLTGTTPDSEYDQLEVIGSLHLSGNLSVSVTGFTPTAGTEFVVLQNDGVDAVVGTFANMGEGHYFAVQDHAFRISYVGGDGNDVVLTAAGSAGLHASVAGNHLILAGLNSTADQLTISDNGTHFVLEDTSGNVLTTDITGATRVSASQLQVSKATFSGQIQVSSGAGNDVLTVDLTTGSLDRLVRFDGGAPNSGSGDGLAVIGRSDLSAGYLPDVATTGTGVVSIGGAVSTAILFSGLEPVDISGFGIASVSLPGADDLLTLSGGTDFFSGGANAALRLSGTSGGVAIETVAFFNNDSLLVNTATGRDGNDVVQLQATGSTHGNQNVTLLTGSGTDSVQVNGDVQVSGNLNIGTAAVTLLADAALVADLITINADVSDGASDFALTLNGTHGASVNGTITTADLIASGAVNAQSITLTNSLTTTGAVTTTVGGVSVGGTASLGANLNSAANIDLVGAVTLTNDVTITSVGQLDFRSTVDGNHNLTLNSAGQTTFAAALGSLSALGSGTGAAVQIRSTGPTTFDSSVDVDSGIVQNNTAGDITFRDNVTAAAGDTGTALQGNLVLDGMVFSAAHNITLGNSTGDRLTLTSANSTVQTTANNANIVAFSAIDGSFGLTVNAQGTGDVSFRSAVGGTTALQFLTVTANDVALNSVSVGGTQAGSSTSVQINATGTVTMNAALAADTIADQAISVIGHDVVVLNTIQATGDIALSALNNLTLAAAASITADADSSSAGILTLTADHPSDADDTGDIRAAAASALSAVQLTVSGQNVALGTATATGGSVVVTSVQSTSLNATVQATQNISVTAANGQAMVRANITAGTSFSGQATAGRFWLDSAADIQAASVQIDAGTSLDLDGTIGSRSTISDDVNLGTSLHSAAITIDGHITANQAITIGSSLLAGAITIGGGGTAVSIVADADVVGQQDLTLRSQNSIRQQTAGSSLQSGSGGVTVRSDLSNVNVVHVQTSGANQLTAIATSNSGTAAVVLNAATNLTVQSVDTSSSAGSIELLTDNGVLTIGQLDAGSGNVFLQAGGANGIIVDGNGSATNIVADGIAFNAQAGIGSSDSLEINGTTIAFQNSAGGNVSLLDVTGGVGIGTVGTLSGATNAAGAISLAANSPITIASNITASGDVTIVASESNPAVADYDHLTVNAGITVQSTGGSVTLQAGDDVRLTAGSNVSSATFTRIEAGLSDNDGDGDINSDGTVTAGTTLTLQSLDVAITGSSVAGGSVSITSDQHIQLSAAADVLSTGGNVSLLADNAAGSGGGRIEMADGAQVRATGGSVQLNADGDVTVSHLLAGSTAASAIHVTSVSGAILDAGDTAVDLSATAGGIQLRAATGIGSGDALEMATGRVDATTSSGVISLSNALATGTQIVQLRTAGGAIDFLQSAGTLQVSGNVQSGNPAVGGNITLTAVEDLLVTAAGTISSATGTGGTLNIAGATIDGSIQAGAGAIVLAGGGSSTVVAGTLQSSGTIRVTAPDDIIVRGTLRTTSATADIGLFADQGTGAAAGDGRGGVHLDEASSANDALLDSQGAIEISGADLIADGDGIAVGTAGDTNQSVRIDADTVAGGVQVQAAGTIRLMSSASSLPGSLAPSLELNGGIATTGGDHIFLTALGHVEFDTAATTNDASVTTTSRIEVVAQTGSILDRSQSREAVLLRADQIALSASTGIGTFDSSLAGDATRDLDIDATTLAAVTGTGDLHISDAGGLRVGTVALGGGTLSGLTIQGGTSNDDLRVSESGAGSLQVSATVRSLSGGDVTLFAGGTAASDLLQVSADISAALAGDVEVSSDETLLVDSAATISTDDNATSGDGGSVLLSGAMGLKLINSITVSADVGSITLLGGQSATPITTSDTAGILLDDSALQSKSGPITLTGIGGDTGSSNEGIHLLSGSTVQTTSGSIRLTGTGGTGNGSDGLLIVDSGIQTSTGNMEFSGIGGSTGTNNSGIRLDAASVQSTGNSNLQLTGQSNAATTSTAGGIVLDNGSTITAVDGAISIDGTAVGQQGIRLLSTSSMTATGSATVRMQANGGLWMQDASLVQTAGGQVSATATDDIVVSSIQSIGGQVRIQSTGGTIIDGGDSRTDVVAQSAALRSVLGIATNNALDTAVDVLAATTETRHLLITNSLAGGLTIGTVDGLSGVTIVDPVNANSGSDLLIQSAGGMTVNASVDNGDGGHVSLLAADDMTINADVVTVAAGSLVIQSAGGNVTIDSLLPTGITTQDGTLLIAASGQLDIGSDVQSSTGAIGLTAAGNLILRGNNVNGASVQTAADIVVVGGDIEMQQNSQIRSTGPGRQILLRSTVGSISVESVEANNGTVWIRSAGDVLDRANDAAINVSANRLQLQAVGQIGLADAANPGQTSNPLALDTQVNQLSASGAGVHLQNATAVTVDSGMAGTVAANGSIVQTDGTSGATTLSESVTAITGLTASAGPIKLVAAGDLTIANTVAATGAQDILLEARSTHVADLNLYSNVDSDGGHITVRASQSVVAGQPAAAPTHVRTTGTGSVVVQALNGDVTMQETAQFASASGPIVVQAAGQSVLGQLSTAGDVAVIATTGPVLDAAADNATTNISANRLSLQSGANVGDVLPAGNSIELSVQQLAVDAIGSVHLLEQDALQIDSISVAYFESAFSDGVNPQTTTSVTGVHTNGHDVLLTTGDTLTINQAVNAGVADIRLQAGGTVTQSAAGILTADELGIRITGSQMNQSVDLGGADNEVRLFAAENLSPGGAIRFLDVVADLRIDQIAGQAGFAAITGLQSNGGDINITSDGTMFVDRNIDATHNTLSSSVDEQITLVSRQGDFIARNGIVITTDEDPTPGVFDDVTGDALTIIAGLQSGNGTVDLPDDIQLRTDGGVARQLAPRPDGFATVPATAPQTAFVTMSDPANMRSSLNFQDNGFLGILDLIFGLPGEENLEVVIDWGVVSQTTLSVGVAGNAIASTTVGGALEFSGADDDKNIFYIDEGGQRYRIPHKYAISDLAVTPNDRNGREDNPNIIGVRFSVAQHRSINVWGQQITDPTGGTPEMPDAFSSTGAFQQITDAAGNVISLPDAGLALLTSTDDNPLSEFAQQAVEAPIGPTTPTPSGTPVGKAEWEFIAGPTPGRVQFEPTEQVMLSVAEPDLPAEVFITVSAINDLTFSEGVSSDSAIGTEVFLQIQRRFERDADPEVVIAKIADQSVVATRERFEEFVRQHPELTDGAGYEIWLITKTGGQSVEQPIVQFEITAGRPGPAMEDLPPQLKMPALQELEFQQPVDDSAEDNGDSVPQSDSQPMSQLLPIPTPKSTTAVHGSNIPPAGRPTEVQAANSEEGREVQLSSDDDSTSSDIAAAAVLMGSAARFCRRLDRPSTSMTRTGTLLRRLQRESVESSTLAPTTEQNANPASETEG